MACAYRTLGAAALSWRRAGSHGYTFLAGLMAEWIGAAIGEQIAAWVQGDDFACPRSAKGRLLGRLGFAARSWPPALFAQGIDLPSGRLLFSRLHHVQNTKGISPCIPDMVRLPFVAAGRTADKLPQVNDKTPHEGQATALSRLALYRLFSFGMPVLSGADRLLKTVQEHRDNVVTLARQASVKLLRVEARLEPAPEPEAEILAREVQTLGDRASGDAPGNPLVMALATGTIWRPAAQPRAQRECPERPSPATPAQRSPGRPRQGPARAWGCR
ncbi:hypothetical protein GCM10011415_42000 [Salipiger pallidus]|uniref:Uncharacterized protein n=1 Tax=Salipiger pallidus TaxID=1775170 RepID=A0A8J2ZPM2_9RHOB|nr:hypothetical protein [Salipiger pallidus]GGG87091.1 hypothetical protein GCM10011415_42000 [Salipiger pallidus]